MQRRQFLSASLATTALTLSGAANAQAPAAKAADGKEREFYLLRRYSLRSGLQLKLNDDYLSAALIPALKRMGIGPVGAFRLDFGTETPANYVLIPGTSVEKLTMLDHHLAQDAAFMAAAEPYWSAPASAPPFLRVEASLHAAFEGWPRITPPPQSATKAKRIFQMRTYESPSFADHVRKVEMFHSGEFDIFKAAGMHQVFYGDTLLGPRMPSLTYMLAFADMTELEAHWDAFRNAPEWKKLSGSPRFAFEAIVSNISNVVLNPLAASEI
jgi:hypothetical protein